MCVCVCGELYIAPFKYLKEAYLFLLPSVMRQRIYREQLFTFFMLYAN